MRYVCALSLSCLAACRSLSESRLHVVRQIDYIDTQAARKLTQNEHGLTVYRFRVRSTSPSLHGVDGISDSSPTNYALCSYSLPSTLGCLTEQLRAQAVEYVTARLSTALQSQQGKTYWLTGVDVLTESVQPGSGAMTMI